MTLMTDNLTNSFLKGILAIQEEDIRKALEKVKLSFIDYIGVTFLGEVLQKENINKLAKLLNSSGKDGLLIGSGINTNIQFSILANGMNSHYLELDDGCRFGVTHPGAPLFSALIPVAKKYKVKWEDFIRGVIVGYETIIRISSSMQPSHYRKGYHPTATCAPLGISMGLGSMLKLDFEIIKDAFSCACISAGGSLKAIENTSKLKVFNAGKASELGFISFAMALCGYKGPIDVLSGSTGFLKIMSENPEIGLLKKCFEDVPFINKTYCKLYPSCRHTHGAIEGILNLKEKESICIEQVERIIVKIYKGVKGKHDIYDIVSEESAKMSIPYSCAVALALGSIKVDFFHTPYIYDKSILSLKNKVEIIEDERLSSLLPIQRSTEVTIEMKDGSTLSNLVKHPKGEPENPVSEDEVIDKFKYLSLKANKSESTTNTIVEEILTGKNDMTNLFTLIS